MNLYSALRSTLIAASVIWALPGTAMAQSSVTLSGLLDISAGQSKAAGSSNKVWGVDNGQMTTSWFGASGSEDLGGGLSALFTLQSFMRADTGASGRFGADTFWARNAFVGLASSSLGKVTIGRNTTPFFVTTLSFNPFGDSFGYSPSIRHYFTSGTLTGDSGWSDSVLYTSPKLGGATLQLFMAAAEAGSTVHPVDENCPPAAPGRAGPAACAGDVRRRHRRAADRRPRAQAQPRAGGAADLGRPVLLRPGHADPVAGHHAAGSASGCR
jgi:predicted porin